MKIAQGKRRPEKGAATPSLMACGAIEGPRPHCVRGGAFSFYFLKNPGSVFYTMKKVRVLNIFKPQCLTSLETLSIFRKSYPLYQNEKLGYAGTLDPLAEGVLVVLVGEENKKRKEYINLDKEYIFSFILGIKTDTYDVLGKITGYSNVEDIKKMPLQRLFSSYRGEIAQAYPPYSSKKVKGKPLFLYAKEGEFPNTEKKIRKIYEFSLKEIIAVPPKFLEDAIVKKIKLVHGDFRQEEILSSWDLFFKKNKSSKFYIVSAHIVCSSGTYVRTLVHDIGERLGMHATVFGISRTRVGSFLLNDSKIPLG
jgi:tRNA pseudouridine55 synthase